jgi:hypothetical protein
MAKEITEFENGGLKEVKGKPKMGLVPYEAIARIAARFEVGIEKYEKDNWKNGLPISECVHAAIRHIYQFSHGYTEEDHLGAALWNLAVIAYYEEHFANDPKICDILESDEYLNNKFTLGGKV